MFAVELLHHREFILLSLVCAKRTSYKLAVWLHSDNDCAINNRDYDLFRLPAFQAPRSLVLGIVERFSRKLRGNLRE